MARPLLPLPDRVRGVLGKARLVYWDDAHAAARLKSLSGRLEAPLAVGVLAGAEADLVADAVRACAPAGLRVVAEDPDAVVLLSTPDAPAPADPRLGPAATLLLDAGGGAPLAARAVVGADLPGLRHAAAAVDPQREAPHAGEDGDAEPDPAAQQAAAEEERVARLREAVPGLVAALAALEADAPALRAAGVLRRLRTFVAGTPRRGSDGVAGEIEDIELAAPEPRETDAAARLRSGAGGLDDAERERALALLDAARSRPGAAPARAGLDVDAELRHWRAAASDPARPSEARALASVLGRACERLLGA